MLEQWTKLRVTLGKYFAPIFTLHSDSKYFRHQSLSISKEFSSSKNDDEIYYYISNTKQFQMMLQSDDFCLGDMG